jgi:hypothetical protein
LYKSKKRWELAQHLNGTKYRKGKKMRKNTGNSNNDDLMQNEKITNLIKSTLGVTDFNKDGLLKAFPNMSEGSVDSAAKYLAIKEGYPIPFGVSKDLHKSNVIELIDTKIMDPVDFFRAVFLTSQMVDMAKCLLKNKQSLHKIQPEDSVALSKHTYHNFFEEDEEIDPESAFDSCENPEELADWLKTYAYKSGVHEVVSELSDRGWDITLIEEERKSQMLERIEELCESAIEDDSTDDLFEAMQEAILENIEVRST